MHLFSLCRVAWIARKGWLRIVLHTIVLQADVLCITPGARMQDWHFHACISTLQPRQDRAPRCCTLNSILAVGALDSNHNPDSPSATRFSGLARRYDGGSIFLSLLFLICLDIYPVFGHLSTLLDFLLPPIDEVHYNFV